MAKIRGLISLERDLLDGASGTGAGPTAREERSKVVSTEAQGNETANQGATGLNNGMDHHGTQLLSNIVSYD